LFADTSKLVNMKIRVTRKRIFKIPLKFIYFKISEIENMAQLYVQAVLFK